MKRFLPVALVLSLLFSSCVSATPLAEPTTTPTKTPNPTATATATNTPTPDPKEQIFSELRIEGIFVDAATGELSFGGVTVPGASINKETGELHIQIGEQLIVIPQGEILQRLSVKEGSVVVYDEKGIDSYKNPDLSQWTEVQWAFNPNITESRWAGWISRNEAVSTDEDAPIQVGNTYSEFFKFQKIQNAMLQPFSPNAKPLKVVEPHYEDYSQEHFFPFAKFTDYMDPSYENPFRGGVNFLIVGENADEGRPKITAISTEQVLNPNDHTDIQVFEFAFGIDSEHPASKGFQDSKSMGNWGGVLPFYTLSGWGEGGRIANLKAFWKEFGYMDKSGNDTGKATTLVMRYMETGVINEELQRFWAASHGFFYKNAD